MERAMDMGPTIQDYLPMTIIPTFMATTLDTGIILVVTAPLVLVSGSIPINISGIVPSISGGVLVLSTPDEENFTQVHGPAIFILGRENIIRDRVRVVFTQDQGDSTQVHLLVAFTLAQADSIQGRTVVALMVLRDTADTDERQLGRDHIVPRMIYDKHPELIAPRYM